MYSKHQRGIVPLVRIFFVLRHFMRSMWKTSLFRVPRRGAGDLHKLFRALAIVLAATFLIPVTACAEEVATELFMVLPAKVYLQDGKISESLRFISRNAAVITTIPATDVSVFMKDDPYVVSLTGSTVTAKRSGWTRIIFTRLSTNQTAVIEVFAGRVELTPPLVQLHLNQQAQITATQYNPDGSSQPCELNSQQALTFDAAPNGMVTATKLTEAFSDKYATHCVPRSANSTIVRILDSVTAPQLHAFKGPKVSLHMPDRILTTPIASVYEQKDAARIVNLGYDILEKAFGCRTSGGAHQHIVADIYYNTYPPFLGHSGNPIALLASLGPNPHTFMLVRDGHPMWHLFWHELSHNFVAANLNAAQFINSSSEHQLRKDMSESFSSLASLYVYLTMRQNRQEYDIDEDTLRAMDTQRADDTPPSLNVYMNHNQAYGKANLMFFYGISEILIKEFGVRSLYRFLSPLVGTSYVIKALPQSTVEQATMFVALWSAATRTDLRQRFLSWRFPIDNDYYNRVMPELELAAAQRDPIIRVQNSYIKAQVGENVIVPLVTDSLDSSALSIRTTISSPVASYGTVSADREQLAFHATKPGHYVIDVQAIGALSSSSVASLQVDVLSPVPLPSPPTSPTSSPSPSANPVNPGPAIVSLNPTTGSGSSARFAATVTHSSGISELYRVYLLFLPTPNVVSFTAKGTCLVEYNRLSHGIRLINDAGLGWLGPDVGIRVGTNALLTNQVCTVNVGGASAVTQGSSLTLSATITFTSGMTKVAGSFIQVLDVKGNWTGMDQMGNWVMSSSRSLPGPEISGVSYTSTTGRRSTYSVFIENTTGSPLDLVSILVGDSIKSYGSCQVVYFPGTGLVNLIDDLAAGMVSSTGVQLGSGIALQTSRCSIDTLHSSQQSASNRLRLNLALEFSAERFSGRKNVYVNAFSGGKLTHWVQGAVMDIF